MGIKGLDPLQYLELKKDLIDLVGPKDFSSDKGNFIKKTLFTKNAPSTHFRYRFVYHADLSKRKILTTMYQQPRLFSPGK